jgi:hypothetical protein
LLIALCFGSVYQQLLPNVLPVPGIAITTNGENSNHWNISVFIDNNNLSSREIAFCKKELIGYQAKRLDIGLTS